MSLIAEVKCRQCGEKYSSLRSTCPSCGLRRVSQSARTPSTTPSTVAGTAARDRAEANMRWQMIFGAILVAAVILAVIVMVSTGLNSSDAAAVKTPKVPTTAEPVSTPEPPPTPTPTPTPAVQSVAISYLTLVYKDGDDVTMHVGDALDFTATAYPVTIENPVYKWKTDSTDLIRITPSTDDGGKTCKVEILDSSSTMAKLTVECYGVSFTLGIRCVK